MLMKTFFKKIGVVFLLLSVKVSADPETTTLKEHYVENRLDISFLANLQAHSLKNLMLMCQWVNEVSEVLRALNKPSFEEMFLEQADAFYLGPSFLWIVNDLKFLRTFILDNAWRLCEKDRHMLFKVFHAVNKNLRVLENLTVFLRKKETYTQRYNSQFFDLIYFIPPSVFQKIATRLWSVDPSSDDAFRVLYEVHKNDEGEEGFVHQSLEKLREAVSDIGCFISQEEILWAQKIMNQSIDLKPYNFLYLENFFLEKFDLDETVLFIKEDDSFVRFIQALENAKAVLDISKRIENYKVRYTLNRDVIFHFQDLYKWVCFFQGDFERLFEKYQQAAMAFIENPSAYARSYQKEQESLFLLNPAYVSPSFFIEILPVEIKKIADFYQTVINLLYARN